MNLRFNIMMLVVYLIPIAGFSQNQQLADSLNRRGMDFYGSGNYRQAEFYLREAFNLYDKEASPTIWLSPGIDYAEVLVDRSKYKKALPLFKKLKKVAVSQGDIKAQTRIENDMGWAYNMKGQYNFALNHLKKAILLAESVHDTLRLGYIFNNIGSINYRRGKYEKSLEYFQKSLSYKNKINNKASTSITLNNLGSLYNKFLLYNKAFNYYERSITIRKQIGNADLLATAYSNLAGLLKEVGEFNQALIYYQQSYEYCKKAGNPSKTAQTLNNIGTLYNELGNTERALQYYRQSLQLKETFASPASKAASNKNIGNRLWDSGQQAEAISYYKRALALKRQTNNARTIGMSLIDLAKIENAQDNLSVAFKYLKQAHAIADSTQDTNLLMTTALYYGRLNKARGRMADAKNHYKEALSYSRSLSKGDRLIPLKELALLYDTMSSDSSLYYGQQVVDLIEENEPQMGTLSDFKAGYFGQYSDFYINVALWILKYRNDPAGAYQLIESAKARALIYELSRAAQRIDESLPENERIKRARQLADISDLYHRLKTTSNRAEEAKLKKEIRTKELAHAAFENQLQQQYTQYKYLERPTPTTLENVQAMCDTETAVLEYALTNKKLIVFFITENDVKTKQFPISSTNADSQADSSFVLEKAVMQFRRAILSQASEDSIQNMSKPIYDQLIGPFEEELKFYNNIIIVPDGNLAYLPFDALYADGNYLVSRYSIKYAPSMTGFSLISKPTAPLSKNILTIANADQYALEEGAPLLPTVNIEIESISKLFNKATILRGNEINENNVKKRIQENYSIVHVAAHSVIDENESSQSGIMVGSGSVESGIGNDGYLRSTEILRLNIPSSMVVLSACKSGIGQLMDGEGMLGLQRAFFNAGTSTVVVSLWDVYDRSTTRFMQLFYKSLMDAPDNRTWTDSWHSMMRWVGWDESEPFGYTSSSMRKAKLSMLEHPKYHHPVYWAPFIVVGR